jgi:hypothetical protein
MTIPSRQARRNGFFGRLVLVCAVLMGIPEAAGAARRIQIEGPRHVRENSAAYYTCTLHTDEGATEDVTSSASWNADSWYARFESEGKLRASSVTSDQWCKITATYDGLSDALEITIDNVVKILARLEIRGPSSMRENSSAYYVCWAYFDDGTGEEVTARADWSSNSAYAAFENAGKLIAAPVTENKWLRIFASYEGGTVSFDVEVENSEIKVIRIKLSGPREVDESSSADYVCTTFYDDGTTENVTSSASWYADSWYATISGAGRLETTAVSADQWFRLTVSFRGHSESRDIKISHKDS